MSEKDNTDSGPSPAGDLRREAERRLRDKDALPARSMAEVDARALLHELQVHQIELEMQNEELLRTQAELHAVSDKYQDLFDFAPVGYFLLDEDGRILEVNLAGAALLGLDRSAAINRRFGQFVTVRSRARFAEFCANVLSADSKQTGEIELQRGEQPLYAMLEGISAHDGRGDRAFRVTATDITERKRAKEELRQAKEAAEAANRAKDHFIAVLSHELRTPLMPVVLGVSMLQDRPDLDSGMRETLEMVRRNAEIEALLINDLLDLTRIASGKVELQMQHLDLSTIIKQAVDVCRPDIEARGLAFSVDLGLDAPYGVEADPSRLQQVFWNLLSNAIKFTPRGGYMGIRCRREEGSEFSAQGSAFPGEPCSESRNEIREPQSLNPGPRRPSPFAVIEVSDNGIGIEPEALLRIFNVFEQGERSITRQFGGLGLGLAISKAIVEMHGGAIEARSDGKGKGATFRIRLPLCAPLSRPEARPPAVSPQRAVHPAHILLVEDHAVTAKMMGLVLTADGHTVETAGDIATALELAGQRAFDLLVSDLGLPDGSGHDLIRKLRERGHKFPGIALSGYGQVEDVRRSHEAGFAAHLTKPASHEAVANAVATVTARQPTTAAKEPTSTGDAAATEQSEPPVFDAEGALDRCFGKTDFLKTMANGFLTESPALLDRLRAAANRGDAGEVAAAAHRLAGTVVYLKATPAVTAAQEVVRIGRSGDLSRAAEAIANLEHQVALLRDAVSQLLE